MHLFRASIQHGYLHGPVDILLLWQNRNPNTVKEVNRYRSRPLLWRDIHPCPDQRVASVEITYRRYGCLSDELRIIAFRQGMSKSIAPDNPGHYPLFDWHDAGKFGAKYFTNPIRQAMADQRGVRVEP